MVLSNYIPNDSSSPGFQFIWKQKAYLVLAVLQSKKFTLSLSLSHLVKCRPRGLNDRLAWNVCKIYTVNFHCKNGGLSLKLFKWSI